MMETHFFCYTKWYEPFLVQAQYRILLYLLFFFFSPDIVVVGDSIPGPLPERLVALPLWSPLEDYSLCILFVIDLFMLVNQNV